jgi:hypothetical protein
VAAHVTASDDNVGITASAICSGTASAPESSASNCAAEHASMTLLTSSRCTGVISAQTGSFSGYISRTLPFRLPRAGERIVGVGSGIESPGPEPRLA